MKRKGDSTHPCFTPDVTWNRLESPLRVRTALTLLANMALMLSRNWSFTSYFSKFPTVCFWSHDQMPFLDQRTQAGVLAGIQLLFRWAVEERRWHLRTLIFFLIQSGLLSEMVLLCAWYAVPRSLHTFCPRDWVESAPVGATVLPVSLLLPNKFLPDQW